MKYMFRLTLKLMIFTAVFTGGLVFLSPDSALAKVCNWAPGYDWGITTGAQSHGMAGLKVNARYGNYGNGTYNPKLGKDINIAFELKSDIPGKEGNMVVDNGSYQDVDARIFQVPVGKAGRDKQHWFNTGETIHSGSDTEQCDGWTALGPGTHQTNIDSEWYSSIRQWGNYWVLDCQQPFPGEGLIDTDFWISNIATPNGESGRWEVYVNGNQFTANLHSNPMSPFNVTNGQTKRIDMIWRPTVPNPGPPEAAGRCTNLAVTNNGIRSNGDRQRIHVKVTGAVVGRIKVNNNPSENHSYQNIDEFVPSDTGETEAGKLTSKEWWYQPNSNKVEILVTVEALELAPQPGNPNYREWRYKETLIEENRNCFTANCNQADFRVFGDGPNGIILAGGNMHVQGTYTNTSPPPDNMSIWNPALAASGAVSGTHGLPGVGETTSGSTYAFNFMFAAPSDVTSQSFTLTPIYFGPDSIGAACTATIDTYKRFKLNLNPGVTLNPTKEDVANVTFAGNINKEINPGIDFSVDYSAVSKRAPSGIILSNVHSAASPPKRSVNASPFYQYIYTPPSNSAADYYRLDFCVSQLDGHVGPDKGSGHIFSSDTTGGCTSADDHVVDRPYLGVYGGDMIAGSGFKDGQTCPTTVGTPGIRTYRSPVANKSGSGTQYAAMALGQISGFSSARLRDGISYSDARRLTFSNTMGISGGSAETPGDGGQFSDRNLCATDFYESMDSNTEDKGTLATIDIATSSLADGKESKVKAGASGFVKITNTTGGYAKNATLYVEGDAVIQNDIAYAFGKNFKLIVEGNIYIDNGVGRLDGLYVAQPKSDGTKGNIYTCAENNTPYSTAQLFSNCRNPKLVVNGAFVAKNIEFLRVHQSLRHSQLLEKPAGDLDLEAGTNAAEVFNFSPEIYLFSAGGDSDSDEGQGPANYITTLPPIL